MDRSLFFIITIAMLYIVSSWFPFERFNIAIKYATIIRIIMGVAIIGLAAANYLLEIS